MTREQIVCDLSDLFAASIREYGIPFGYAEVELDIPYPEDHVIAAACAKHPNGEDAFSVMVIKRSKDSGRQRVVKRKVVDGYSIYEVGMTADRMLKDLVRNKSRRKYRQGERITSLDDLMSQDRIFFMDKVVSAGWFGSWQIRWVLERVKAGQIYYAVKEEKDGNRKDEAERNAL